MEMSDWLYSVFWAENFWLPGNVTWKDFENGPDAVNPNIRHAQPRDLLAAIPVTVILLSARFILEKFVLEPIGRYFNLRSGTIIRPENISALHKYYKKVKKPTFEEIDKLANELTWNTRQIERWFRKRRNLDKSSEMKKYCESSWRFIFYSSIHIYGIFMLYNEKFLYDIPESWYGYPHHEAETKFYWYYVLELSFYVSLSLTLMTDVKRKDFPEMIIHHLLTIYIAIYSWSAGFFRIGTVVIFTHDAVDYWLEGAKICKYLRKEKLCDFFFVVFTIVWTFTRLYYLPCVLLYACWTIPDYSIGVFIVNALLSVLQLLHYFWSYGIYGSVWKALTTSVREDYRSESEVCPVSDDDMSLKQRNHPTKPVNNQNLALNELNGKTVNVQNGTKKIN